MKLFVFDVSNIFYRAFYGGDRLTTSYGMPVNGLHGFLRMVHGIMQDHKPDLVAFAMEGGGTSVRKQLNPEYKANRSEPPADLVLQLEKMPELMQAMGYPTFKLPNYEADDVICTLVTKAVEQGLEPVIVSSDKDFCQLVQGSVKMLNLSKNEMVDENGVFLRYEIRPDQFIDYLSIVGDSSDNIQGVKGIGPKGAADLLKKYDNLDNIYRNLSVIKGATLKKLTESREQVFKARELVRFIPLQLVADLRTVCNWAGPRVPELKDFLERFEFRSLASVLIPPGPVTNVDGLEIGTRR
jgi:DNA polymerase I